jgi:hypothetical protein
MFFRKSDFSINLLKRIWDTKEKHFEHFHEQCAFNNIYENADTDIKNKIFMIPKQQKHELITYWGSYYPNTSFLIHNAGCTHLNDAFSRLSFMYMMDNYCIIKLDEETNNEYKIRLDWLLNKDKCRADIDRWIRQVYAPRQYSARCKKIFFNLIYN